jgi:hypothetical protein
VRRNIIFGVLGIICVLCGGCGGNPTAGQPRPTARPTARATARATLRAQRRKVRGAEQDLTAAVEPLIKDDGGHVAIAVDDLTTGADADVGGTDEFITASIVKVDILSTLLYQLRQTGQTLTSDEQWLAETMIENSDNDSATDLYYQDDGSEGIDDANRVFGLTETTVGTGGYWGLTNTTVTDQIRLLRQVFTDPSALSASSQDYIRDLMSQVESDQQWGVSAAASAGTVYMLKNGWLPSNTTGLWEINSIGEVVHARQRMLIAVLSDDNATEDSGISVVESIAAKAAAAIADAPG